MNGLTSLTEREAAAILLIACGLIFTVGGILFTGRVFWKWQAAENPNYLRWERGFVILAVLATVLGLVLLDDLLGVAGDSGFAQLAMVTYLIGATVVLVAETTFLSRKDWNYAQIVLYVMLAFLSQAGFGVALLQTNLIATWVGWFTIVWNIGCFLILIIAAPRDIYYPALHHVAPVVIGIALLWK